MIGEERILDLGQHRPFCLSGPTRLIDRLSSIDKQHSPLKRDGIFTTLVYEVYWFEQASIGKHFVIFILGFVDQVMPDQVGERGESNSMRSRACTSAQDERSSQ